MMVRNTLGSVAVLLGVGLCPVAEAANPVPFVETFSDSAGDGFDLSPWVDDSVGYNFAINAGGQLEATLTDGARSYSVVETSGIPSSVGTKVTVSTDFTLTDTTTSTTRLGLLLFGTSSDIEMAGPDPESYSAYISEPGGYSTPVFVARNIQTGTSAASSDFTTFTGALTGTTFNLTVDATIGATDLTIDYILTDLINAGPVESGQVTLPITAAPLGDYFGVHVDRNSGGPESTVTFDNYSVSYVPEPMSALLLATGAGLAITRRRV